MYLYFFGKYFSAFYTCKHHPYTLHAKLSNFCEIKKGVFYKGLCIKKGLVQKKELYTTTNRAHWCKVSRYAATVAIWHCTIENGVGIYIYCKYAKFRVLHYTVHQAPLAKSSVALLWLLLLAAAAGCCWICSFSLFLFLLVSAAVAVRPLCRSLLYLAKLVLPIYLYIILYYLWWYGVLRSAASRDGGDWWRRAQLPIKLI